MNVIEINDEDSQFEFRESKPRRIIFCIDTSVEMSAILNPSAHTGVKDTSLYYSSRMESTQIFLERYVRINKMIGNTRDEYGIICLSDEANWWYDFNPDLDKLKAELEHLHSQIIMEYEYLDVESLFKVIESQMTTDDFFYHVIVIYARTNVMPVGRRSDIAKIRDSPNMTMDVIFMHDSTESVQEVYDYWNSLDSSKNPGWYYETGTHLGKDKLSKALCKLIAHPLQRGEQNTSG